MAQKTTKTTATATTQKRTKDEIFAATFAKRKSTGNERLDAACSKILLDIRSGAAQVTKTESGFQIVDGKVTATVEKVSKGKANRIEARVAGIALDSSNSGWFWKMANQKTRVPAARAGAKKVEVSAEQEALLAELIG